MNLLVNLHFNDLFVLHMDAWPKLNLQQILRQANLILKRMTLIGTLDCVQKN